MPITQLILQALSNLHQNAQANLPVMPNNGNPQGANNMPSNPRIPNQPMPGGDNSPPWLAPSPAMEQIRNILASYGNPAPDPRMGFNDGRVAPPMPTVTHGQVPTPQLPPLPQARPPALNNQVPLPRQGMGPVRRY